MSSIPANLPLRNDLIGEEPYGAPQLDVPVCLNVNENPYAPDPAVCDTIAKRVREIAPTLNRYPDREHIELRQAFSDYLARESGTRLDVDERDTFTGWKLAHRNADFTLNVDKVLEAIAEVKPSMVLLTSPNNPTGTPLPMEDIERILAACETAEVVGAGEGVHPILVIDEAYVEFRKPGTPSAVSLIKDHPNLAVSRTMSKAFAFAGARVGYLAASKGIIDCVRIVRMPYHLSAVTQAAALAAFEHTDEQLSRVEHLRETREATAAWLKEQTYKDQPLEVAESGSNFLLFGGHFDKREAIFDELLKRGVLIRVVGPDGWLRVCMGTDEEMETFRNALVEVLRIVEAA